MATCGPPSDGSPAEDIPTLTADPPSDKITAHAPDDDEAPRCRYCFETSTAESALISPCACSGHQAFTHRTCLIKWQRRQGRGTSSCEVCKTPWTVNLDALDRELFVHSVKTNPRYPLVEDVVDRRAQDLLLDLLRPGTLILQTPARAEESRNLAQQMPARSDTLSMFAFMLTLQRVKHWLHGSYLIVSRGDGDGTDGSDALVAINLVRPTSVDALDSQARAESQPLFDALDLAGTADRDTMCLLGGPCHSSQPLCLLELPADAVLPTRGDVLRLPLALPSGDLRAPYLPEPGASEPDAARDADVDAAAADVDAAAAVAVSGADVGVAAGARQLVAAEPAVAAEIVRANDASHMRACIVQGCAIWSTKQLVSEISRHKWGLVRAAHGDVPFDVAAQAAPAEQADADAPALWRACWRDRRPTCTPSMPGAVAEPEPEPREGSAPSDTVWNVTMQMGE